MGVWLVLGAALYLLITTVSRKRKERGVRNATLRTYVRFRGGLNAEDQERFDRIAHHFAADMDWRGVGMEVPEEMKAMISACAAQLLLHMPDASLDRFHTVLVHKDAYRTRDDAPLYQGHVKPALGTITISWRHFLHGYAGPGDGHNVGLHEMAHALWFEHLYPTDGEGVWPPPLLAEWKRLAQDEMTSIREGRPGFLGTYAGTNQAEFFAVAVEHFFERPVEFSERLPSIYTCLSRLLRQDPAAKGTAPPAMGADRPLV